MRGIPIFTFMNKLDRDGRDPLELIAELEEVLEIDAYPMNWPMGMGKGLLGLYDLFHNRVEVHRPDVNGFKGERFAALDEEGHLSDGHPITQSSIYEQV